MPGPLHGHRILDVSRVLAGPFCSMILGDLGAEVIKVEPPEGDVTRTWGPPFLQDTSGYYLSVNRNKRSVSIDLKTDEGREIVTQLARSSDVFLENFRPGVAARLGLDDAAIRRERADIVYCSISGYGQDGPDRDKPSFDIILQGLGGFMGITGESGRPPVRVGVAIADLGAGLHAAIAILAALVRRAQTGEGEYIDVSILDGQLSWLTYMAQEYFLTGASPQRLGSRHPHIVPYQTFPTTDGHLVVAAATPRFWQGLCHGIGREDLQDHPDYASNESRVVHREALEAILKEAFRERPTAEWVAVLEAEGVPCAPVYDVEAALGSPQARVREMVREVTHPGLGEIRQLGPPFKLGSFAYEIARPPPQRGEHSREILAELGYDEARIDALFAAGVVR